MPAASKATTELVRGLIASARVRVFAKSTCPYCIEAAKALKRHNIEFALLNIDLRKENDASRIQDSLVELTGQRTVPNVFANGYHIGGCDATIAALDDGSFQRALDSAPGKFGQTTADEPATADAATDAPADAAIDAPVDAKANI
ncbi:thioredoxin reductase [Coemansia spiralis]|nr:thioredoxin reductase [Coemansia spiralis]